MKKLAIACILLFCLNPSSTFGQSTRHYSLKSTIAAIDTLHKKQAIEKLYIQTDKPYYAFGDTMRFKAYLLDESLSASLRSGLFYIELVDDSSMVVKRQVIMLNNGTAWGDIVIKNDWSAGDYTLRAYTNWMRNGPPHFFTRRVSIVSGNKHWLVNNQVNIDKANNVNLMLRFSDLSHHNLSFRDMRLSVIQSDNVFFKKTVKTSPEGRIDIVFPLPLKHTDEPIYVLAEDMAKDGGGTKITIPIQLNRPQNTDLQFMPEGGNLVAGITSRVGFKAIGEDGLGIDISGKIINSKKQEVATFRSAHKGMGSFELTPQAGESYTAKVTMLNDSIKTYPLPMVHPSGITLRVDTKNKDSLDVMLSASADLQGNPAVYYLVAEARDKALYGARIVFNEQAIHKKIAKNIFPTGIATLVLLDAESRPVTQRLIFINHDDLLNINLNNDKESYSLRDSIALELLVKDADGKPVPGNFSLAVTDDSRVKPFNEDEDNIVSNMLLNPHLTGNIESPGYYFNKKHPDSDAALDNLLLTQGWAGYDWKQLFTPEIVPEFEAEIEYSIKGRASDVFGLPIRNTTIMLMSTKPAFFMKTKTIKGGRFTFSGFPEFADTLVFHLQPNLGFNIGIKMYGFYPPDITPVKYTPAPWYINSDSTLVNYVNKKQAEQEEAFNIGKSKLLKEVVITDSKKPPLPPIVVSMNSEDLRNTQKKAKPLSVLQLIHQLQKKLGGQWNIGLTVDGRTPNYALYNGPFDWLYQYDTNDIKSLTIRQSKYNILVAVITNSGKGDVLSGTKGNDFRPMPISWPHQFYSPRYTVKTPGTVKDNRSTIYWAPNILTDANGSATGSFFSADTPGTYTLILEGTDLNGNVGYLQKKITIHQ